MTTSSTSSSLTITDFCDLHEISPASFYQWRRKLRSQADRRGEFLAVEVSQPRSPTRDVRVRFLSGAQIELDAGDKEQPNAGIFQTPRPAALIAGDRYDTSFAAAVIANRLGYHLPIYRQEDMFAECGLHLSRSTLLNLQEAAERVLRPFAAWLADLVRTDRCLGSDDTSIRLGLARQ